MAVPLLRALFRSDSASAGASPEPSPSPVEALCRVFCVLAVGALLFLTVSAGLCALMPGPGGRGGLVLTFGLIGLLLFYARLQWVSGPGRLDIFYDGLVPTVTGLMLVGTYVSLRAAA